MRGHFNRMETGNLKTPINEYNKYTGMRALYRRLEHGDQAAADDKDLEMAELWDIGGKA